MNKEIKEALRIGDDRKVEEYINQLELNVEALEMEHKHDIAAIDEAKGNAVKWSKERDSLKVILDKVTEECRKQMKEYEDSILEIFPQKILNIIEGEKNNE